MTQLRQKMIRAMELKNLSHHTQRAYLAAVKGLVRHYQQTPDKITEEMIDDYLLHRLSYQLPFQRCDHAFEYSPIFCLNLYVAM